MEIFKEIFDKINKKLERTSLSSYNKLPYTTINGIHDDKNNCPAFWTNGFWPALMTLMYSATGEKQYFDTAKNAVKMLDKALFTYDGLNHDVGFMWDISSGALYRLNGDAGELNRLMIAANHMMGRYNCCGEFFRAWNDEGTEGWSIIDCMMNLPLLYRASEITGDKRFAMAAMKHADKTAMYHVREDGSCRHIVEYNPENGEFVKEHGGQGYGCGSSWTRGQAWGIYGFAMSCRFTKKKEYLDTAMKIARYFAENIGNYGYITPCDFKQPKFPEIVDTTAAACAACGLLELSAHAPELKELAEKMILALYEKHCDLSENNDAILLDGTEAYTRRIHIPIIYGDYFFTEAVCRLLGYDADFMW